MCPLLCCTRMLCLSGIPRAPGESQWRPRGQQASIKVPLGQKSHLKVQLRADLFLSSAKWLLAGFIPLRLLARELPQFFAT